MEQVLVVGENGDFFGECPKCGNWKKLEFAHHEYSSDNYSRSTGMYLCHKCNMKEKAVNPEKTTKERGRVGTRDYLRENRISISMQIDGKQIQWVYNRKTGFASLRQLASTVTLWSGNIGTDYPEIVYVQDGEIEK